jgi:hypothetical protein
VCYGGRADKLGFRRSLAGALARARGVEEVFPRKKSRARAYCHVDYRIIK